MLPVLLRRQPPFPMPDASRRRCCPAGPASARSIVELMSCLASSFWLRPRMGPRSGGVARQGLRLCRHRPKWKAICVPSCVPNSPVPAELPNDAAVCQPVSSGDEHGWQRAGLTSAESTRAAYHLAYHSTAAPSGAAFDDGHGNLNAGGHGTCPDNPTAGHARIPESRV